MGGDGEAWPNSNTKPHLRSVAAQWEQALEGGRLRGRHSRGRGCRNAILFDDLEAFFRPNPHFVLLVSAPRLRRRRPVFRARAPAPSSTFTGPKTTGTCRRTCRTGRLRTLNWLFSLIRSNWRRRCAETPSASEPPSLAKGRRQAWMRN